MGNVPAPCVGNVPGALHGKCPRRTKHPAREFCACAGISEAHNAQSPLRCAKAGDHNCIVIIKNPRRTDPPGILSCVLCYLREQCRIAIAPYACICRVHLYGHCMRFITCICCVHLREQCMSLITCICRVYLNDLYMVAIFKDRRVPRRRAPGDAPAARIHALAASLLMGEKKKSRLHPSGMDFSSTCPLRQAFLEFFRFPGVCFGSHRLLAHPMYTKMWGSVCLMYMVRSVKNLHMNGFAVDRHFCVHAGMAVCQKNGLLAVFVQKRNGINLRRRSPCERK